MTVTPVHAETTVHQHSSDDDYRGITADNQLHYRGNPSTGYSIPTVLPQDSWENPRYYRGYRGITAVPITVQLSIQYLDV